MTDMQNSRGCKVAQSEEETDRTGEVLAGIGRKILTMSRDELYFSMRFLDVALSSFSYVMDCAVSPFGTDGRTIWFHPGELGGLFRQNRILVNRGYLHMVFHCIFRHMFKQENERRLWDISCDIAVEHLIDGCDVRPVRFSRSLFRREVYRKLEKEGHVLHAERIFRYLQEWKPEEKDIEKLEEEFRTDDHERWENRMPGRQPDLELARRWKDLNEKMETDLETFSKEAAEGDGDLLEMLKAENRERYSYREFLRKFSVFREELRADADTFDPGLYSYGLALYGNMPLIEPQETREVKKVSEIAVVIDTSMSCSGELVKTFLHETYAVLRERESYFRKVNIHIIQCDEKVRSDMKITSGEELARCMEQFQLTGGGGTDFRPAFEYVDRLVESGAFTDLKGLIYFTDGYGIYPGRMPSYPTAFVFLEDEYRDVDVPAWGIRLILSESDIKEMSRETDRGVYER